MSRCVILLLTICLSTSSFSQDCLDIDYKLRGYFIAGSTINDSLVPGGYYADGNYPKPMSPFIFTDVNSEQLQLIAATDLVENATEDVLGFKVYLVNGTSKIQALPAQDSRLYVKRQVCYQGEWVDIEYLPSSWCGNSYHDVYIKPYAYWEFIAPCMQGKTEVKCRFELYVSDELTLYSNVFDGSFNTEQLDRKQGYGPENIMDPYND